MGFGGEWLALLGQFFWLCVLARVVAKQITPAANILLNEYTICTEPNHCLSQFQTASKTAEVLVSAKGHTAPFTFFDSTTTSASHCS
jgi:hypothetical protein